MIRGLSGRSFEKVFERVRNDPNGRRVLHERLGIDPPPAYAELRLESREAA